MQFRINNFIDVNMICRLCLKDLDDMINIFDVTGLEINMASVVGKHFWFVVRTRY